MDITTPSGLSGIVRGLSARDGRFLADLRASRENKIPDYILSNCWTETTDAGVYGFRPGNERLDWGKILVGDRDYTLMQIRIASYGSTYPFKVTCQNGACQSRYEWDIELEHLPVNTLKEKDREAFRNGNRFEAKVPGDERAIVFKLATGADVLRAAIHRRELRAEQRNRRTPDPTAGNVNLLVESVLMRVVSIEGIENKNPRRLIEAHREALEDLPMQSFAKLLDLMDEHDCGINTTIETVCPSCEAAQDTQLPFDGDFFFPRKSTLSVGSTLIRKTSTMETTEEIEEDESEET